MSARFSRHCWEAVLEGELTPAMAEHLARCDECARMVQGVAGAAEELRDATPTLPADVDARVLAAVERSARPAPARARVRPWVIALGAAVLLLVLLARPAPVSDQARAVAIVPLTSDCGAGDHPARGGDDPLLVAGVWHGAEARAFARVLRRFERASGVRVTFAYETHNIAAKLKARLRRGCPPDVALLPQPGLLAELARHGQLKPLDAATTAIVRHNYRGTWRRLATVDHRLYGVWFKAAHKSTFWYRPAALAAAGVGAPPRSWPELLETSRRLAAAGIQPLAVAGADPWTLTDWFENLYLRTAGPIPYARLAAHRIPWTDPSVTQVLRRLAQLFGDQRLVGAPAAGLETSFEESIDEVFGPQPRAAMVYEGDFVRNFLPRAARAARGSRAARLFDFPAGKDGERSTAVVGGDAAVLFNSSPGARRLVRFLATPQAALPWARAGGFLSPNLAVNARAYPDDLSRRAAESLARAGTVRFDLSDLQPPAFGATAEQGMWSIFQDFLADPRDAVATARRLERAASAAWACQRAIAGRC
jgi:ABC-type glycerol-3-phosphate transport system substrate-binding protein